MATFTWTGATDGDATDQANWADGSSGVPGAGDDLDFTVGPSNAMDGAGATGLNPLVVYGDLSVDPGYWTTVDLNGAEVTTTH